MKHLSRYQKMGWLAVGFSVVITCAWAYWGAIETFHEGWYYESLVMNIGLALAQYLSPMLVFMCVGLISIMWHRVGGAIHIAVALFAAWFFSIDSNAAIVLIMIPLLGIGVCYWFGSPPPRKIAARLIIGVPVLVMIIAGVMPAYRVSQRIPDRNLDAQLVHGNEVKLTWAPGGPGWPQEGAKWHEAIQICHSLDQDGKTTEPEGQDIWRLPTVDEAVRSMALHGANSRGVWDGDSAMAVYDMAPDKEFPLWDIYSQVIYWWTATEIDEKSAYIIVYDGKIWPRTKQLHMGNLGFRCVR